MESSISVIKMDSKTKITCLIFLMVARIFSSASDWLSTIDNWLAGPWTSQPLAVYSQMLAAWAAGPASVWLFTLSCWLSGPSAQPKIGCQI